jgi:hypothetical protein
MDSLDRMHLVAAILAAGSGKDVESAYLGYREALWLLTKHGTEPIPPNSPRPDVSQEPPPRPLPSRRGTRSTGSGGGTPWTA